MILATKTIFQVIRNRRINVSGLNSAVDGVKDMGRHRPIGGTALKARRRSGAKKLFQFLDGVNYDSLVVAKFPQNCYFHSPSRPTSLMSYAIDFHNSF